MSKKIDNRRFCRYVKILAVLIREKHLRGFCPYEYEFVIQTKFKRKKIAQVELTIRVVNS